MARQLRYTGRLLLAGESDGHFLPYTKGENHVVQMAH